MRYRVTHRSAAARPGLTQVLGAMATVSVIGWYEREPLSSGWGVHAPAQFRKELRRSVNLPLARRREIERDVKARNMLVIDQVDPAAINGLRLILEALGAKVAVEEADTQRTGQSA